MKDFRQILERCGDLMFNRIEAGNYEVSIQASYFHYCSPRKTFTNPFHYEAFEVAIFHKNNDEKRIQSDSILNQFDWAFLFVDDGIGNHINTETVQQILNDLETI